MCGGCPAFAPSLYWLASCRISSQNTCPFHVRTRTYVYVHVRTCTYTCTMRVRTRVRTCILPKHTWFSVHMCALFQSESCDKTLSYHGTSTYQVRTYACVCTRVRTPVLNYTPCTVVPWYTCMYVHMYVRTYMHACTCIVILDRVPWYMCTCTCVPASKCYQVLPLLAAFLGKSHVRSRGTWHGRGGAVVPGGARTWATTWYIAWPR